MRRILRLFNYLVKRSRISLCGELPYVKNSDLQRSLSEANLDHVAYLNVIACLCRSAVNCAASQASLATVLRLMILETFRYLSKRMRY